jgi:ABC-type phosphate transport system permease subunit
LKTINLNKKSWHYWVATTVGSFKPSSSDFCKYVRHVILGSLLLAFFSIVVAVVVGFLGGGLINIGILVWDFLSRTPYTITNAFMQAGSLVLCMISAAGIVGALIYFAKSAYDERKWANEIANTNKPDSFVKNAYKTFRNKACFKVNFNE